MNRLNYNICRIIFKYEARYVSLNNLLQIKYKNKNNGYITASEYHNEFLLLEQLKFGEYVQIGKK